MFLAHPVRSGVLRQIVLAAWVGITCIAGSFATEGEWPRFRGPNADGISPATDVFGDGPFGLDVTWKHELGSGYSGIAVAGDRLVTMFSNDTSDLIAAFDRETGAEIWRYELGPVYAGHDGGDPGPLSTPLIAGDSVFGLGARGTLYSFELATGKLLWSKDLAKDLEARAPFYGFSLKPSVTSIIPPAC